MPCFQDFSAGSERSVSKHRGSFTPANGARLCSDALVSRYTNIPDDALSSEHAASFGGAIHSQHSSSLHTPSNFTSLCKYYVNIKYVQVLIKLNLSIY